MSKIKKYAKEFFLNNKEIISETFKNLDMTEIAAFSKQKTLKRIINNIKDKTINNFHNTDDIPNELNHNIDKNLFFQYDGGVMDKERMLIFINSEKIIHLKNASTWLSDGTFKMAPIVFFQIYIIFAKIFDDYFPLVYSFLPNKNENTYFRLFEVIARLVKKKQT
ncbi:hypothetical protein DMUE_0570 [Dictyocoela muelleri]|nr:hypothetical protein DMUE_0570 [Dictyocoela muelleri]